MICYAVLIYFWSNEFGGEMVNIDELLVKKESRPQGIGRNFVEFFANEFKDKAIAFCLETTQENYLAYKFDQKLGFKDYKNTVLFKQL
ncbi:MAG: hypothetical protein IGS39_07710 [Calothrix sp. C42_A2020_038]|nr:hypothetical protein [Calothrix sp. C42_A2020_038]